MQPSPLSTSISLHLVKPKLGLHEITAATPAPAPGTRHDHFCLRDFDSFMEARDLLFAALSQRGEFKGEDGGEAPRAEPPGGTSAWPVVAQRNGLGVSGPGVTQGSPCEKAGRGSGVEGPGWSEMWT